MEHDVVREYYNNNPERELLRLNKPYRRIEFSTTCHLIDKYFPEGSKVLDIGCGPGRYSLELLERGHHVSLLDLSQNELDIAKRRITEAGYEADNYYCQSAMDLSNIQDSQFDAILVMGPMYHIHGEDNRINILKQVKRILKPDGLVLAAYLNKWGVIKASLKEFPTGFGEEHHLYDQEGNLELSEEQAFTRSCFTTPPIAIQELKQSGFDVVTYAGAESFLSGMIIEVENLATYMPETYNLYIEKACKYCELPQYRDATEHLHIVVKKGE